MIEEMKVNDFVRILDRVDEMDGWDALIYLYTDYRMPILGRFEPSSGLKNILGFGPAMVKFKRGDKDPEVTIEIPAKLSNCYVKRADVMEAYRHVNDDNMYPWKDEDGNIELLTIED